MRRFSLAVLLVAAGLLSSCREEEDQNKGVGAGPGPASYVTVPDGLGGTLKVARAAARSMTGASGHVDAHGLPGGEIFDGSLASRAAVHGGPMAYASSRAPSRLGAPSGEIASYTAPARKATLRTGEVPGPVGVDFRLQRPDPAAGAAGANSILQAFDNFQRYTYSKVSEIVGRRAWGAAAPNGRSIAQRPNRVTVHHTDGNKPDDLGRSIGEMRGIQAYHMRTRGWQDVGYHFVIDGAGRVLEGRHSEVLGAHAGAANMHNIGVAVMGNYNKQQLNEEQKSSMRRLITFLAVRYHGNTEDRGFIQGHMHYMSTDCPGVNVLAFLDQLRREVDGETKMIASASRAGFTPLAVTSGR